VTPGLPRGGLPPFAGEAIRRHPACQIGRFPLAFGPAVR
jgi:hypothetical protein